MAKRKPPSSPPIPEWVLTYGDLMSLLLCFFILLAAFSELKRPDQYRQVIEALREAFGFSGGPGSMPLDQHAGGTATSLLEQIRQAATAKRSDDLTDRPDVTGLTPRSAMVQSGLRFAIGGSLVFQPGSADLSENAKASLRTEIGPLIRDRRTKVEVRGHAWGVEDRLPDTDAVELSFRRAKAVMDFLVRECAVDPAILLPVAVGESEPVGVSRHDASGHAENRRVQVILTEVSVDEVHPDPHWTGRH